MEKGKTIKQLADEIGVSKTAIRNKLNDEIKTKFAIKIGNTLYILPKGESIIKSMFLTQIANQTQTVSANQTQTKTQTVSDLVFDFNKMSSIINILEDSTKLLQEQLKQKDLQLEQKDNQIKNLQEENKRIVSALENTTLSLQASQTLHAKDIQLLSSGEDLFDQPKKRKSFFDIFKKQ